MWINLQLLVVILRLCYCIIIVIFVLTDIQSILAGSRSQKRFGIDKLKTTTTTTTRTTTTAKERL